LFSLTVQRQHLHHSLRSFIRQPQFLTLPAKQYNRNHVTHWYHAQPSQEPQPTPGPRLRHPIWRPLRHPPTGPRLTHLASIPKRCRRPRQPSKDVEERRGERARWTSNTGSLLTIPGYSTQDRDGPEQEEEPHWASAPDKKGAPWHCSRPQAQPRSADQA
jgi:hypothetical protein